MMFSLSFAVLVLCTFGINGNTIERGYPFGKLRLAEDGKNEELIATTDTEKSLLNLDQVSGGQPLSSPCTGIPSSTKIAYPKDKTKYIQCRDEFHYEIFTCPNGGEYNEQSNTCDVLIPKLDRCEQEKPCLNDGQCTLLSNSTFKCICRADWTGDRCETPINSCVNKPCGLNADCRSLKTTDYEQDYVCVCHATQSYGLNCQESVPNPCLITSEQFFPFAFSQRAYIQCDGDLVHFQPCGPSLYWSQEEKICDRKRPAKVDLAALLAKLAANKDENKQENQKETVNEEMNLTGKSTENEQQSSLTQNTKENEKVFAFVPARVAHRQQFQVNANNQQGQFGQNLGETEQQTQQLSNQLSQSVDSNQNRQVFTSKTQQWPSHQVESTMRQTPTTQLGQNQLWSQNTPPQLQGTSSLSQASSVNSNLGQFQTKQDFPQQNQGFGTQQWLNQVPDMKTQNNQRFGSQSQAWQGSQINQDQTQQFQARNQKPFLETTTPAQNIIRSQGSENLNSQGEVQSWRTQPNIQSTGLNTQNTQIFASQPQSWQNSQSIQNQLLSQNQNQQNLFQTTTTPQTILRLQGFQKSNVQGEGQPWQNRLTQSFASQPQSWQNTQFVQNQQPLVETTTTPQNIVRLQGFQNTNAQTQDQSSQNRLNIQSTGFNTQNTQSFASQPQSWQSNQFVQNQQPFVETTTTPQNVISLQSFQNSNAQGEGQSWQNRLNTQTTGFNTQKTQGFVPQTQTWQSSQISQNQQPLVETTTATQNVISLKDFQNTNSRLQDQRSNTQPSNFNTQTFASQPQSWQSIQFVQNQQPLIETTTVTQNVASLQNFQNTNLQTQDQPRENKLNTQSTGYQSGDFNSRNNQNFVPQTSSWQNTQTMPKQQQLTSTNTEGVSFDTKNRLNTGMFQNNQFGLEQQNLQNQQSWQNKGNNQIRQSFVQPETSLIDIQQVPPNTERSFPSQTQQNQAFGTQQWLNQVPDMKTQNNQRFGSQSWQTQGDKLPSNQIFAFQPKQWPETSKQTQIKPSSEIQTTQYGVNQQQDGLLSPSKDSDEFKMQANQNYVARPSLETTTMINKGINQGMFLQGSTNWQPTEQRKTLDSIPTLLSGSWKNRS